jgi:four helix bundle protein
MENGQAPVNQSSLKRIRDFTDLETWRFARQLRVEVYRICQGFPKNETFGPASQIRRAAVSVTANIAEGFGRYSYQENIQFCRQSRGSVYELRDHFTTALDAGYITKEQYAVIDRQAISVIKLINGYIRSTKGRKDISKDRNC